MSDKNSGVFSTMHYMQYFDLFEDLDELKKAAKIWVGQDIKRLKNLEARIENLLKAVEFLATYSEQDYVIVDGNSVPCGTGSQTAREALVKDKELRG